MRRETDKVAEVWKMTKKLGSVLGDTEDVARRKHVLGVMTLLLRNTVGSTVIV